MVRPVKRSFSIKGHRTSLSLEPAFWDALNEVAATEKFSITALVTKIDANRGDTGLSSAVRLYLLDHFREAAETQRRGATVNVE